MTVASPKLSVVTITLDDVPGLRFSLDSLMPLFAAWPQSDWEHVIVDGAPERSRPLLDRLPAAWPLVHVTETPDGVPRAFNRGLEVATGVYAWFLNGGDGLRDRAALERMLAILERDPTVDLVCAGAYLSRSGVGLYPTAPWRSLAGNLLGRNWMYHQAVIYRRASLRGIGPFSSDYRVAGDYDLHLRGYAAGLRARFITEAVVDYDMSGGSNDVGAAFREFKRIQRSHRHALPAWMNGLNEIVRPLEYARVLILRTLSSTGLGIRLRPLWASANRWLRGNGAARPRP